jgi:hypothetical protein
VNELQAAQREQLVDFVDRLAMGGDRVGQAAGGDVGRLLSQLLADPPVDPVDQAGEAVGEPRLNSRLGVLPCGR